METKTFPDEAPFVSSKSKKIEKEALQLPANERATLAEHLLESLDGEDPDPDAEQAWIEEAERRYEEYKKDKTIGRPSEAVLRDARKRLK